VKVKYEVVGPSDLTIKVMAAESIFLTLGVCYPDTPYFLMGLTVLLIFFSILYGVYLLYKLIDGKIEWMAAVLFISGLFSLFPKDSAFLWTLGFAYAVILGIFVPFAISLYYFIKSFKGEKMKLYSLILAITSLCLILSMYVIIPNLQPDPHFSRDSPGWHEYNEMIDCNIKNNSCLIRVTVENSGYLPAENILIEDENKTLARIDFIGGKEYVELTVWTHCNWSTDNYSIGYGDCRDCDAGCVNLVYEGEKKDFLCVYPEYPCTDTIFIGAIVLGAWMRLRKKNG
jgi:hypothetical protein